MTSSQLKKGFTTKAVTCIAFNIQLQGAPFTSKNDSDDGIELCNIHNLTHIPWDSTTKPHIKTTLTKGILDYVSD